jgi:hypothetical protein
MRPNGLGLHVYLLLLACTAVAVRDACAYEVHYLQPNTNVSGAGGSQYFGDLSLPDNGLHAVMWTNRGTVLSDLHPAGHTRSTGATTDGNTQVGGVDGHAALWHGTSESFVDLNPAGFASSIARGVGGGQQVGVAYVDVSFSSSRAMLWTGTAASAIDLTPAGTNEAFAKDTDGVHQVGQAYLPGTAGHAVLWQGTAASMIDLHPHGAGQSRANAIGGGVAVGWSGGFSGVRATIWNGLTPTSAVDVHPGNGYVGSSVEVTNGTQHAGHATIFDEPHYAHAFVWDDAHPLGFDLHSLLPAEFFYSQVRGIDANGDVVGNAIRRTATGNEFVSVVWAVPEPSAGGTILALTALIGCSRRLRRAI